MKQKNLYACFFAAVIVLLPALAPATGVVSLPRTGQTTCYLEDGTETACSGTRQDGDILAGVAWPDPRFVVTGDEVLDKLTGLTWAKNGNLMVTRDPAFDTDYTSANSWESPNDGLVTWQLALN